MPRSPLVNPFIAMASVALVALTLSGLVGCEQRSPTPSSAPAAEVASAASAQDFGPVATVQELMQSLIDPSADAIWDAVSTTVTAAGEEQHLPKDDAAWQALRLHAVKLSEAANLLATLRPVAHPNTTLEDDHVVGILDASAIEALIQQDPATFRAQAGALRQASVGLVKAIEARNIDEILRLGAELDHACESCHQRHWYPNDKRPTE